MNTGDASHEDKPSVGKAMCKKCHKSQWPVRLMVGMPGFHPEGASSILARVTDGR